MKNYEIDVGAHHWLMAWVVRRCSWILCQVQTLIDGRTAHKNMRDQNCDKELVHVGKVCLARDTMQTRPSWSFDGSQESSLERKVELTSVCFCPTWTKARRGWLKNLGIERALGSALVFRGTQTGQ